MNVLGLTTEDDCGATLVCDGRIVATVNEERLARLKLVMGFPHGAIETVLKLGGLRVDQLDAVLVASTMDFFGGEKLETFDGWFQYERKGIGGWLKMNSYRMAPFRSWLPLLEPMFYAMLAPAFRKRQRQVRQVLRDKLGVQCPIKFVEHHFAHIASAYFTSGFDDALVVSLDGGGDGKSGTVYAVRDGEFDRLHDVSAFNSLGNYYAYVTHICGFKAMKHEGKITGLAAHGEPKYLDLLDSLITERNGTLLNTGGVYREGALRAIQQRLPNNWKKEDLAASIQQHFEALTARFVRHWARQTGLRSVALAGGVFANVRVNQVIHELEEIDQVFVFPHMTDGGLAAGAGLAACVDGTLDEQMAASKEPLDNVYLGPSMSDNEIDTALAAHNLSAEELDQPLEERIADLLADGYVVARADGPVEYGPRALGNRSILYQPTDPAVNDWLNEKLRRTEFMPFAPATMFEHRERCFENLEGALHTAQFMTITFNCTPWMCENMAGVVHIDGTARPQLVRREQNPGFHRIIEAFHDRTGLPAIINTSFNMHEEPIVCSANDCVRAFLDGGLDFLALGSRLIKHPAGITHPLKPVHALKSS